MSPAARRIDRADPAPENGSEPSRDWREILWELRVLWLVVALLITLEIVSRPLVFKGEPTSLAPPEGYAGQAEQIGRASGRERV